MRSCWALVPVLAVSAWCTILPGSARAQPVVNAVANAASYDGSVIAPGEMVVIFGSGLGPTNPVSLQLDASGRVSSSLAGVLVTFNGIQSPLVYVSASQIAAMTPYELAGLGTAQLQVTYASATSLPFPVKLVATMPGIFTANASGAGNAAATNADGSLNSASNPALPGSYITFYLTGEGQTNPAGGDGEIAPSGSSINAPVAVTIGGIPAQVLYAGSAPGEVNGFAQINAVVPSDLQYGGNVPVVVQIGNITSQPGLTIAVAGSPAPLSLVTSFSPNVTTISTSEGAPYGDCDFWAPGPICSNESDFGYGPTKVMRLYICLSGEVAQGSCSQNPAVTGPLSAGMLTSINSGIAAYGGSGMRLIIRFTYNFGPIGPGAMDAPINVISTHIDQLAPILLQNKDLIFALEAGFIGTWGEWHSSTNGNDTAAAQKVVLDKELNYFNGVFPVLVRYPGNLITYTGSITPPLGLGLHDDFYASNSDDGATWNPCAGGYCLPNYSASQLMSYAAEVSTNTMFVGEFGGLYPVLQTCDALDAYSYTLHPQSITIFPGADIGTELQNEGCAQSFYNRVGTRIVLQRAAIIGNPIPGGQLFVALTIMNAGYGRVIRQRPVTLVLIQTGRAVAQIPIPVQNLDLRTLQSFASETFQFEAALPTTLQSGPVSVALLIPDPAPSLSSIPAYALPFNSLDQNGNPIFDPTTGYNYIDGSGPSLGPAFLLDPSGSLTSNPNEVIDGASSIKGSYTGTGTFTPYLETVSSVLPLTPDHSYQVTFRYKILTTPTKGFETLFYSPTGGAAGNFLPSVVVTGQAGDTGTATLTNTLGNYTDYEARWDVPGTGAIAIDDIQIIDLAFGKVIAAANVEPTLASPLIIHP